MRNHYWLMRHGPSEANAQHLIVSGPDAGVPSYGLTEAGKQRATESAAQLRETLGDAVQQTIIYCSDFKRTTETAHLLQVQLGCAAPVPAVQLRERFFGKFELTADTNYNRVWVEDGHDSSHVTYGAESVDSVRARSWGFVCELEAAHEQATIVLVAHGDTLQILQTAFCGVDPRLHRSLRSIAPAEWRRVPLHDNNGHSRQLELVRMLRVRPGANAQLRYMVLAGDIVALVGGGGKTSLMYALARQLQQLQLSTVCTTTTKFRLPRAGVDCDVLVQQEQPNEQLTGVSAALSQSPFACIGVAAKAVGVLKDGSVKCTGVSPAVPALLMELVDVCVVEADGSRMLPFKAPAEHEPVLPDGASVVIAVAGADVVSKPLDEDHVCRAQQVAQLVGASMGSPVLPEWVGMVIGDREAWAAPKGVRTWAACLNKVDLVSAEVVAAVAAKAEEAGADLFIATSIIDDTFVDATPKR